MTAHQDITPAAVSDFPGYRVSTDGRVESCRGTCGKDRGLLTDHWHVIRPRTNKVSGHLSVKLRRDGKTFTRYVHHLVLNAFVGPCPPGLECRHKDGDPSNNRLDNLAWGTRAENMADRVDHGTSNRGERHGNARLSEMVVVEIRRLAEAGMDSGAIGARFGIHPEHARDIIKGDRWTHVV